MKCEAKDKYSCLTDNERAAADRARKGVEIIILISKACESLMAEVCGHGVTDWGIVNDALVRAKRFLMETGEGE